MKQHKDGAIVTVFFAIVGVALFSGRAVDMPTQTLDHVPTSVSQVSLNDNGWGVWTTGRQSDSQVFLWDGKKVRPLGQPGRNNRDAAINLNNWVVWSARREDGSSNTDIFLWKGEGEPVCLSARCVTSSQPHLNNRGDVVWWGSEGGKNEGIADIFYLSLGMRNPINLTKGDKEGASRNPRINDAGIISYERSSEKKGRVVTNLVFINAAQPKRRVQITDSDDLNVTNSGINTVGELVYERYDDIRKQWQVWKYFAAQKKALCLSCRISGNHHFPDINESGLAVWNVDNKGNSELYWTSVDSGAEIVPVAKSGSYTRPAAINSQGQVLYASGDGSGTGFDILLAQPREPYCQKGLFLFGFALCSGVLISLIRGNRAQLQTNPPL